MYFDFYMDSLSKGRTYVFDFLIKDQDSDQVFTNVAAKFSKNLMIVTGKV